MSTPIQINIPAPCHENWNNMTQQEQGRFCGACQKVVVDFSVMTDKEIIDYFSAATQRVCGRFADDQLNKELKPAEHKRRFSWAYVWNVLLATFLITEANAQVKPKKPVAAKITKPVKKKHPKPILREVKIAKTLGMVGVSTDDIAAPPVLPEIYGTVIDAKTNLPVAGAHIRISETARGVMVDTAGKFYMEIDKKQSAVVEITAVGYEKQVIDVNEITQLPVKVLLKADMDDFSKPVVIDYSAMLSGRVGGATMAYRVKRTDKLMASLSAPFRKDIKVYPNPVARGNNVNVSLQLKQAGDYKLEVLNTAGEVVHVQPLVMVDKKQTITLATESKWVAGVYWIRISSPAVKNIYQGKILVQ